MADLQLTKCLRYSKSISTKGDMEKADTQAIKKLKGVAALWRLELMRPDELINAATEAIVEGLDSTTLEIIAGLTNPHKLELKQLAEKMFNEFGMIAVSAQEEASAAAHYFVDRVTDDGFDPLDAAQQLSGLCEVFGDQLSQEILTSTQQALTIVAKCAAKMIIDGKIDPYVASAAFWSPWMNCRMPEEISTFVLLGDYYEDNFRERDLISQEIIEEARRLTKQQD